MYSLHKHLLKANYVTGVQSTNHEPRKGTLVEYVLRWARDLVTAMYTEDKKPPKVNYQRFKKKP